VAPPRAFDHELLKALVLERPDWSDDDYAEALTKDLRETDPTHPPVKRMSVSAVLSRKRSTWERQANRPIPPRLVMYREMLPPTGAVDPRRKNHTILRYIRELAKDARGIPPLDSQWGRQTRQAALHWGDRLALNGEIADLDSKGFPIVRRAVASEKDVHGNPLAVAAWLLPGWGR
jgi:hypothetical protein